ncbi:MAG: TonB-dependent receptor [Gammaproteobacteria bacterium]|nr:TonB-dependent receptor [Gammaproteobacteria bacterium]
MVSATTKILRIVLHSNVLLILALSASIAFSGASNAQEVEEVVIQGQQTNEVLDDLVSVAALDAEKLADAGIENVEDVAAYVPNLVLTQSETGTNIFIRGIGAGVNQGFDQSVGLFSDGVPLPRANMARAPFLDLASVQVLRGPQYTLDGNYSIAGSVHMISNLSVDEMQAKLDFNYIPSQGDRKLLLTAGGPVNDWLALNGVLQVKKSDGYIENVFRNEDGPGSDELLGRVVLGLNLTENLSFKLKVEHGEFDTTGRQIEVIFSQPARSLSKTAVHPTSGITITRGPTSPGQVIATPWVTEADFISWPRNNFFSRGDLFKSGEFNFAGREYFTQLANLYLENTDSLGQPYAVPTGLLDRKLDFRRAADADEFSENTSDNFTLVGDLWLGDSKLTSTSSYIEYEFEERIDSDFTPVPLLLTDQDEKYDQIFQEVRFSSPRDSFLEVTMGASFLKANLSFTDLVNLQIDERKVPAGASLIDFDPAQPFARYFAGFSNIALVRGFAKFSVFRDFKQEQETSAAYFKTTLNWSDKVRATLGLRYTHSEKMAERELLFVDKDGQFLPVVQDPADPGLEGRTADLDADDLASLQLATANFAFLFGLQVHTDRYSVDGTTLDAPEIRQSRREEKLLPALTFEWDATSDLSFLLSARMANKLGGFDARSNTRPDVAGGTGAPIGTFEFFDEDALVYELGTKWYLPAGIGEMNATAFFTRYKNLQLSRSDGKVGANVDNAGIAETRGIEVEGLLTLTERFNMTYSLAWIDFEFIKFFRGSCPLNRRADNVVFRPDGAAEIITPISYEEVMRVPLGVSGVEGSGVLVAPVSGAAFDKIIPGTPVFCDFAGQTNQFVAEWQGTFSFNYETEIRNLGIFSPTLDVLYNSGYETVSTQDSDVAQDKYFQFNGRLELSDFDGAWTVALTGENLTNEKIVGTAAPVPVANGLASQRAYIGFIRPPRSIGLNVRYNFF